MDPVLTALIFGGGGGVLGGKALELVTRILSPVADELGQDLRDRLAARRARNLEAIAERAVSTPT